MTLNVAVVERSMPDVDVDSKLHRTDMSGNMASGVDQFAVDEGLAGTGGSEAPGFF
jgi:hypothetical protein